MKEPTEAAKGRGAGPAAEPAAEEDEVRRLLEEAGPRAEVLAEDLAAIKAAFRAAWREQVAGRRLGRPPGLDRRPGRSPGLDRRLLALAATVLAAVGLGWWLWSRGGAPGEAPLARVESLAGGVTARAPGGHGRARAIPLAVGVEIPAGAEIATAGGGASGAGRATLRLPGGASLRVDAGSRVRLVSRSAVELAEGALYLDSGPGAGGGRRTAPAVAVHTAVGVAQEVGTQFEVRLLGAGTEMRVRVREGAVRLGENADAYAAAGEELTLHADGSLTRRRVPGHGPAWDWVLAAAPPLAIEGRTLAQCLDWVSRETGWTIRYEDPGLAAAAGSILVHGSLGHLTPDQAPGVVLPGAGLEHRLVDGVLFIRAAGGLGRRSGPES